MAGVAAALGACWLLSLVATGPPHTFLPSSSSSSYPTLAARPCMCAIDLVDLHISVEPDASPPPQDTKQILQDGKWTIEAADGPMNTPLHTLNVAAAGKLFTFQTGKLARLASGAVTVNQGDTNVFCTACLEKTQDPTPIDFTPVRVDYMERSSAVGQTKKGYIKRDGKPSDHETLVSRLIDRPIRPLIPEGWSCETQLAATVLSYDSIHQPDVLAICGTSAALCISEIPFAKPVAAARVAMIDGEIVVNPTHDQMDESDLDMILAGTSDAILMVEGFANFVPEAKLLEALEVGMETVNVIARALDDWRNSIGKASYEAGLLSPRKDVYKAISTTLVGGITVPEAMRSAMTGGTKQDRENGKHR